MNKGTRKVGKYEVGRTIGEGTFAKVKFAKNVETGESVAVKVMTKSTILKHKMVNQVLQLNFTCDCLNLGFRDQSTISRFWLMMLNSLIVLPV